MPERFELGTLPYELLAGTTAAVDFLAGLDPAALDASGTGTRRERLTASLTAVERHEDRLRHRIEEGLAVGCPASSCTPVPPPGRRRCCCRSPGATRQDAYRFLAERGVNAPAGTFYALEASRRLGFGDRGSLRVGLAPYTDDDDVDRLLDRLGRVPRRSVIRSGASGRTTAVGTVERTDDRARDRAQVRVRRAARTPS